MYNKKFIEMVHKGKCDVCGNETYVTVCCSTMSNISFAYCKDCLENYREPYYTIVSCIALAGGWSEEINHAYQKIVRKNLKYYSKSEEEFSKDVNDYIKDMYNYF